MNQNELEWAQDYLEKKGIDSTKITIGINTGASWPAKIWPPDRFVVTHRNAVPVRDRASQIANLRDRVNKEPKRVRGLTTFAAGRPASTPTATRRRRARA